jgi:hypothetical protein
MSFDDDLRAALRTRAVGYEPTDDGWDEITGGVRAAHRRRLVTGAAASVAVLVLGLGLIAGAGWLGGDDAVDVDTGPVATQPPPPETTTTAPTTTAPTTTAPTTTPPTGPATTAPPAPTTVPEPEEPSALLWPYVTWDELRAAGGEYAAWQGDPVAVVDRFAREFLGMQDPVVLEPPGGDGLTFELRPRGEGGQPAPDGGPTTVVSLARLASSATGATAYLVTQARSPNIVVDSPGWLAPVGSPLAVRGRATGYEGTVIAEVREAGMGWGEHLGDAVGIAGTMGELGPMTLDVTFSTPTTEWGVVVVHTTSGLDNVGVPEATVVKVHLQP